MPLKIYFANFKTDAKFLLHLLLGNTKLFNQTIFFKIKDSQIGSLLICRWPGSNRHEG